MDCVTVKQVRRVRSGHSVGRGEKRHPRPGLLPCDHPPGGWTTGVGQTRGGFHCLQRRPLHQLLRVPYACGRLRAATSIIFVATNMCLSRQNTSFFRDKSMLVATKRLFSRDLDAERHKRLRFTHRTQEAIVSSPPSASKATAFFMHLPGP